MEGTPLHVRIAPSNGWLELATIRDLLGHTTTRMTERYPYVAPSHLHAAVQTLPRTAAMEASIPQGGTGVRVANATRGIGDDPCDRTADREVSPTGFEPVLSA